MRQTRKKVLSGKKTVYPSNRGCAVSVSPDAFEKLQKKGRYSSLLAQKNLVVFRILRYHLKCVLILSLIFGSRQEPLRLKEKRLYE